MKKSSGAAPSKSSIHPVLVAGVAAALLNGSAAHGSLLSDPIGYGTLGDGHGGRDLLIFPHAKPLPPPAAFAPAAPIPVVKPIIVDFPIDPGIPFNISFGAADVHIDTLETRLQVLRDAEEPAGSISYDKDGKEVKVPAKENRWSFFAAGSGLFETVRASNGVAGYHTTTAAATVGADYRINDHLAVGITGGYAGTDAPLHHGGHMSADTGRGGVYGTWYNGPWYVDLSVLGGGTSYDAHYATRHIGSLTGADFNGTEVDSALRAGYDLHLNGWTLGPTVELRDNNVSVDSYDVKSIIGKVHLSETNSDSLRTRIGFHAASNFRLGSIALRPEVQVAWQHEYLDQNHSIDGVAPGPLHFTDGSTHLGHDSVYVYAGASAQLTLRVSAFLFYVGDLGRSDYSSHSVTGGFGYSF